MRHAGIPDTAAVSRALTANGVQPTLLSGHTFGDTNPIVASSDCQDTKQGQQEGNSCSWERKDQINNQWIPESKFANHNSKI